MTHPAALPVDRLLVDCSVEFTRRGGPGGQHRNKVETAVVVVHRPTGIRAEASERRSQATNRTIAVHRLRVKLALAVRSEAAAEPSPLWLARRAGRRISVNVGHDDFPVLLAEALDALAAHRWVAPAAAASLGVTASQLGKLLKLEPEALHLANTERRSLGLPPCQ